MKPLTPNLIERARDLRARGVGWRNVARDLDVSEYVLRCELEPHYRQYKRGINTQQRAQIAARAVVQRARPAINDAVHHNVRSPRRTPAEVEAARNLALELRLQPRSVTAELLGDPLPGRSALDQRRQK
jgi:hypothetical protein